MRINFLLSFLTFIHFSSAQNADSSFFTTLVLDSSRYEGMHVYSHSASFEDWVRLKPSVPWGPFENLFFLNVRKYFAKDGTEYTLVLTSEKKKDINNGFSKIDYSKVRWKILIEKDLLKTVYDISIKDGYIAFMNFGLIGNELKISGFYSPGTGFEVEGAFAMSLDSCGTVVNYNSRPLPEGFFSSQSNEWSDVSMSGFLLLSNGGYAWTCHKTIAWFNGGWEFTSEFSELCLKINPDNTIAFVTKIPKMINSLDGHFHSTPFVCKDNIYIIYHDKQKNIGITDEAKIKPLAIQAFKELPALVIAKVNNDGTYRKEELMPSGLAAKSVNLNEVMLSADGSYLLYFTQDRFTHKTFQIIPR